MPLLKFTLRKIGLSLAARLPTAPVPAIGVAGVLATRLDAAPRGRES